MAETHCRHFTGYKPCKKNSKCDSSCPARELVGFRVLVVHLEALGAVLRSTSLLAAIRRKYPRAQITWITKAPAQALLQNLDIDRVLTISSEDLLKLASLEFDVALVIDKSLAATGVLTHTSARNIFGFTVDVLTGSIIPASAEAVELWQLGLNDEKKFFVNKKSEQQLTHEALALGPYGRDPYEIRLTFEETELARQRSEEWGGGRRIIGLNTGCSPNLPHKKLSVEGHRQLIGRILTDQRLRDCAVVLLGGPEDTERNAAIGAGLPVVQTHTELGLRDGLVSVAACDVIFTGDSLGMHMAIGLEKWVVAWFGPTCHQEIDLYGRGRKILTRASCSPCWKRVCHETVMCYDQVDFSEVLLGLNEGIEWRISFSNPHFQETSSLPSL